MVAVPASPRFNRALVLCGLVALFDGYDAQVIAYVAPVLSAAWEIPRDRFGLVFAAGLLGMMAGGICFGPLADRYGRKPAICVATLLFGGFAILTALVRSMETLALLRFLTGVGLGAAVPNLVALTAEHAPEHRRAFAISVMVCGFPLGALVGGLVTADLIERFGWPVVFLMGGVLPLLLLPVLFAALPESPAWLAGRRDAAEGRGPVRVLLSADLLPTTLLLWIAFFSSFLVMFFLYNWLPTVFVAAGESLDSAIRQTLAMNVGGIIGGLTIARLIDRWSALRVLVPVYFGAAVCVAAIGWLEPGTAPMAGAVFAAGFGIVGGQIGCNALTAGVYPTTARATGVGWAFGLGRLGSVVGPVIGGVLMAASIAMAALFGIAAAIAMFAAAALAALVPVSRKRALSGRA